MPMIVMTMLPAPISTEGTCACAILDMLEMERIAQILMNVQKVEMIAMQMPHVLM
jgi:hypothetical protein